jgi:hypothetical protein
MKKQAQPVWQSQVKVRTARATLHHLTETGLGALVLVLGILLLVAYSGAGLTT